MLEELARRGMTGHGSIGAGEAVLPAKGDNKPPEGEEKGMDAAAAMGGIHTPR